MNTLLWILTGLLATVFAASGVAKSTMSRDRLIATGQTGIAPFPMPLVRVVAVCELLAAFGLVLPWATGTARVLTPVAALGLVAVMYGAAVSHASLREPKSVAANLILLLMLGFLAANRIAALV